MANNGWGHALAAAVNGYMSGTRMMEDSKQREEDRAQRQQEIDMRKQEHDAKMAEIDDGRKLKLSLASAAKPAEVNQNAASLDMGDGPKVYEDPGVANSDYRQARGLASMQPAAPDAAPIAPPAQAISVQGKAYGGLADAQVAADAYNKPEATNARLAGAYMAAGKPAEALALGDRQTKAANDKAKATREQAEYAAKLKKENVFDGLKYFRAGNAKAMFDTLNASGEFKLLEQPELIPVEKEIPGIGKVQSYDAVIKYAGPDGKVVEQKLNSHDLSLQMMPYEKAIELQRKGSDSENKGQYQNDMLGLRSQMVELQGKVVDAKAARAASGGDGKTSREERLRYTQLFSDAGRRMGEAQKALSTLQRDPDFARAVRRNPTGPEALQLQSLQGDMKSYQDERTLYQGMLAGSQDSAPGLARQSPSPGQATSKAKSAGPVSITSKAERDALPKGAEYIAPDGQKYVKQ